MGSQEKEKQRVDEALCRAGHPKVSLTYPPLTYPEQSCLHTEPANGKHEQGLRSRVPALVDVPASNGGVRMEVLPTRLGSAASARGQTPFPLEILEGTKFFPLLSWT